jgi:hypothetical protein
MTSSICENRLSEEKGNRGDRPCVDDLRGGPPGEKTGRHRLFASQKSKRCATADTRPGREPPPRFIREFRALEHPDDPGRVVFDIYENVGSAGEGDNADRITAGRRPADTIGFAHRTGSELAQLSDRGENQAASINVSHHRYD